MDTHRKPNRNDNTKKKPGLAGGLAAAGGAAAGGAAFMGAAAMMNGMSFEETEPEEIFDEDLAYEEEPEAPHNYYTPEPVVEPEEMVVDPNEIVLDLDDLTIVVEPTPGSDLAYSGPITAEDLILDPEELIVNPDNDPEVLIAEAEPLDPNMIAGFDDQLAQTDTMSEVAEYDPWNSTAEINNDDFDVMNDLLV
ncbi:MAG: hypothetical protein K2L16_07680 [Muribaculaceae bacterium]|nr:hypothetical protein [Muribaculaceae bacterium]